MIGKYMWSRVLSVAIVASAIALTGIGDLLTAIAGALVAELVVRVVTQEDS